MIADLDHLNHSTERDFLRIGGKLAEFIETVNLISSGLTALADLIAGEQGPIASNALACALDRSMEMKTRAEEDNGLLGGTRQEAGRLKQALSGFKGTVSTFQTIGVLTRVETARLGSAGADFGGLADDVKSLAETIQARVETALDTAAQLLPPIERVLQYVSKLQEGQADDLPRVISGVLSGISSFRDIQDKTYDASVRLSGQYGAVSNAFTELIVSLQFHDITRQQVEHVIDALRRLSSESGDESADASLAPRGAAAVLALQSRQLADAGEKFAASAASVARNMDQIARHVLEMAGESRTLSGLSADETNSVFLQMEQGCTAILGGLGQCAATQATVRTASSDLAETIGRMRGPIEEIQTIEIQMRRMALNAAIRAAHLGATGDTISVLADSMQQLASECTKRSDLLVEALGSVSEATGRLSRPVGPVPAGEGVTQDGALEQMRTAVEQLHSSSERSFAQIAQIVSSGARLSEDLSATGNSFSVGAVFAEAISHARSALLEIGGANPRGSSLDGGESLERGLEDLAARYTMQAERDVHQGVAGTGIGVAPATAPAESPVGLPEEAPQLEEGVDFF